MKWNFKYVFVALGALAAGCPVAWPEAVYARVERGAWPPVRRASELALRGFPEYAVVDGELFLRKAIELRSLFFEYGPSWEWDAERIESFRERHPELEGHWDRRELARNSPY